MLRAGPLSVRDGLDKETERCHWPVGWGAECLLLPFHCSQEDSMSQGTLCEDRRHVAEEEAGGFSVPLPNYIRELLVPAVSLPRVIQRASYFQ